MKLKAVFTLLLVFFTLFVQAQKFETASFYTAISSKEIGLIDHQIKALESSTVSGKQGYEGALLMKKAGLLTGAKEKLSLFKKGRAMLEEAIEKDEENAEFKFLRLIIQENAPGILKYNKELEKDSTFIRKAFSSLPEEVQDAILNYSKNSKIIKPSDFQR